MAYMFCNHAGCNETVKVPAKFCHNHMIKPLKNSNNLDLLDKANKEFKAKKTTK